MQPALLTLTVGELRERRGETGTKTTRSFEDLTACIRDLREQLKPQLALPLKLGEKAENYSRAQMADATIRFDFLPESHLDTNFLNTLAAARRAELLTSVKEGLFLETNYPFGADTSRLNLAAAPIFGGMGMPYEAVYYEPVKEQPYLEVRRLHPNDGPTFPIGHSELSAFSEFFRLHHILF